MRPSKSYSDEAVRRRRTLGAAGERLAADAYERAGHQILDRNWRCRDGELDLIIRAGDVIVFCEVKTRSSNAFGVPAAAVTPVKQRRIRHLAMRWLDDHDVHARSLRFDVASVIDGSVDIVKAAF
ncbi:MAG TPA: YraN family protein [Acidimicrobiales bacterium]|nr:YraN family protein [Acidimicrobiales bacterium]